MKPTINALRAITGVYFQKVLVLMGAIVGGVLLLLYLVVALLMTQLSGWWGLLLLILIPVTLVGIVLFVVLRSLSNRLIPNRLTSAERKELNDFAAKTFSVVEAARTPLPMTVFLIAKDVAFNRESNYLSRTIKESGELRADFEKIRAKYKE